MDTRLCPLDWWVFFFLLWGGREGEKRRCVVLGLGHRGYVAKLWKAFHCLEEVLVFLSTDENNSFPYKV